MVDTWTSPKRDILPGDTTGAASWVNGHGQDLDHLKQRLDGLVPWTNSGAQVTVGGLLIQDALTGDSMLKPSLATAGQPGPFWVALTSFGAPTVLTGYAAQSGYALLNYTGSAPARGDRLQASATSPPR
jgi:hypothetical protein